MHPSLITLSEISGEDWSQRYHRTWVEYDKKCLFVSRVVDKGVFLFNDGSVPEEPQAQFVPRRLAQNHRYGKTSHKLDYYIANGLNKIQFFLKMGGQNLTGSEFFNDLANPETVIGNLNSKFNLDEFIKSEEQAIDVIDYSSVLMYFNQDDFNNLKNYIRENIGNWIDGAGFRLSTDEATATVLFKDYVRNWFNGIFFVRQREWCDRMYEHYLEMIDRAEWQDERHTWKRIRFTSGKEGMGFIPEAIRERVLRPEPEEDVVNVPPQVFRGQGNFDGVVMAGGGGAGGQDRDVWREMVLPQAALIPKVKELKEKVIRLDLTKLNLNRPVSRWFVSQDKPVFISYTNSKQFKRGLRPEVALLFAQNTKGFGYASGNMPISQGCSSYGAAYTYKNKDIVRRTFNQVRDELKAKGFIILGPQFMVTSKEIYYKNVKLGTINDQGIILRNMAFQQEIEEFIYNPKVKAEYNGGFRD